MDNIIIGGVSMPRTRKLEIGGEYVSKEAIMASGKIVRDVIGWRTVLAADWEWVPADTLIQIIQLARAGGFIEIAYPDSTGQDMTALFSIEIGNQKIFKFNNGVPFWYNVQLTATAQEVS